MNVNAHYTIEYYTFIIRICVRSMIDGSREPHLTLLYLMEYQHVTDIRHPNNDRMSG